MHIARFIALIALTALLGADFAAALERSTDPGQSDAKVPVYEKSWSHGESCTVSQARRKFDVYIPAQGNGKVTGFRCGDINEIEFEEIAYYLYQPKKIRSDAAPPVIVSVHSSGLEALRYLSLFIGFADQERAVVLSPYFSEKHYRRWRNADASGECLLRMLDHAETILPSIRTDRIFIFGHSAGGQFTHRFAMRHPSRIAKGFSSGAGNYTFSEHAGEGYDLDGFLDLDFIIGVGEKDTNPKNMGGDPSQGKNRVHRAHNFHRSLAQHAKSRGKPLRPRVLVIPGAGHSGAQSSGPARKFFGDLDFPSP